MESEHAAIGPALEAVDRALSDPRAGTGSRAPVSSVPTAVLALADLLTAHTCHEEHAALPLIDTHLGVCGWKRFTRALARVQGLSGAAEYVGWILDGASAATKAAVLDQIPPPARILCRVLWLSPLPAAHNLARSRADGIAMTALVTGATGTVAIHLVMTLRTQQ